MTVTAKPWLGLYGGLPATTEPAAPHALQMFTNTLHRAPQAPLIHYFDTHITAAEIDQASSALAVGLINAGVEPGDRVAMYLQNVPQAMITLLAAWKCGAVVVPCNPMLRDRELTKILVDSGTRVLICLDDLYDDVAVKSLPLPRWKRRSPPRRAISCPPPMTPFCSAESNRQPVPAAFDSWNCWRSTTTRFHHRWNSPATTSP